MSSSFLTSWMNGQPDREAPENTTAHVGGKHVNIKQACVSKRKKGLVLISTHT